jgi:hypothetical protein
LGLELALTRGPVALLGTGGNETHLAIRALAQILTGATAAFCLLRGLLVLFEGWHFFVGEAIAGRAGKSAEAA